MICETEFCFAWFNNDGQDGSNYSHTAETQKKVASLVRELKNSKLYEANQKIQIKTINTHQLDPSYLGWFRVEAGLSKEKDDKPRSFFEFLRGAIKLSNATQELDPEMLEVTKIVDSNTIPRFSDSNLFDRETDTANAIFWVSRNHPQIKQIARYSDQFDHENPEYRPIEVSYPNNLSLALFLVDSKSPYTFDLGSSIKCDKQYTKNHNCSMHEDVFTSFRLSMRGSFGDKFYVYKGRKFYLDTKNAIPGMSEMAEIGISASGRQSLTGILEYEPTISSLNYNFGGFISVSAAPKEIEKKTDKTRK